MLGKLAVAALVVGATAVVRAQVAIMLKKEPDVQKWEPELAKQTAPIAVAMVRDKPGLHLGMALRAMVSGMATGVKETIEFGLKDKNTGV